jgi:hypothetical protein
MKLWLLSNTDDKGAVYDAYNGFVIAANSEAVAREIANENAADEGRIWENPKLSSCELIGNSIGNRSDGIILSDFHAG